MKVPSSSVNMSVAGNKDFSQQNVELPGSKSQEDGSSLSTVTEVSSKCKVIGRVAIAIAGVAATLVAVACVVFLILSQVGILVLPLWLLITASVVTGIVALVGLPIAAVGFSHFETDFHWCCAGSSGGSVTNAVLSTLAAVIACAIFAPAIGGIYFLFAGGN